MVLDGKIILYVNSGALITKCTILTKLNTYPPNYYARRKSLSDKLDYFSVSNLKSLSIDNSIAETFDDFMSESFQDSEEKDMPSPIQTHKSQGEEVDDGRSLNKHKLTPKSKSILLSYLTDQLIYKDGQYQQISCIFNRTGFRRQ